ncbi:GlxA family transcriptional regulator [Sphingobium sp. TKS]|uniref:GlxA family transcriptional regulator n=1 Tax=Sphingobium sp. TKS TaxID=1315974 RepID=UPI000770543A|nr:GlxA family transcriptional regulator [Sphingobium sp. TKS]AMK24163.1 AraC family transcriptional regulator [Sphingobium sp. TKS]
MQKAEFRTFSTTTTPHLRVAFLPMPNFTMLALAGFIDTLRLAADEGDRSRQIHCQWSVLSENRQAVRASNGVVVQSHDGLIDCRTFDYIVVVGGTLQELDEGGALFAYLRGAAGAGIPLVGLCNGVLTLARAGLMRGRRACVSWFHHLEYAAEFPDLRLISDRMFLVDGNRITCPGGVGSVHLASWLVERHLGPGSATKGLRIMLEEAQRPAEAPQPVPALPGFSHARDRRVRKSLLAIERLLSRRLSLAELSSLVGSTPRNLTRLFLNDLGMTPKAAQDAIRMDRAKDLLGRTQWPIAQIADECGFTDASHLIKRFRASEGMTPSRYRGGSSSASSVERCPD